MRTGKIPYSSFKVQLYFPILGLAVILKRNFPMSGEAANGEIFFSVWLLSLEWGNIIVPWMTNREFFPSPFFKMTGLTFLFTYWKLSKSTIKLPLKPSKQIFFEVKNCKNFSFYFTTWIKDLQYFWIVFNE